LPYSSPNFHPFLSPPSAQIIGGPNERRDFHINETPEWFYQHKGDMVLRTIQPATALDDGARQPVGETAPSTPTPTPHRVVAILIQEGDMFLLPSNVPHSPIRYADTIGLVIEQKRPPSSLDRLRWYCQSCGNRVHEVAFHCVDLGTQIKDAIKGFEGNARARKCPHCGTVCALK